jgi:hypothetical protein
MCPMQNDATAKIPNSPIDASFGSNVAGSRCESSSHIPSRSDAPGTTTAVTS